MNNNGIRKVVESLSERFASTWSLLSDTTIYLSNNKKLFPLYENRLRELRHKLESHKHNTVVVQEVREEVALIRKNLRRQGYNLKMGSIDLKLDGFRNDEAIAKGFKRCVLYILESGEVRYITGMANHIDLDAALEQRLLAGAYHPIQEKHYLWFRWINRVLYLSGAASETKEDFEDLNSFYQSSKSLLLKGLRKIS